MSQLPLVTIITPSYNQGRFIEETILSVLNQDYPNIEYIIIDGGSTDNSLEIIKKYEDRLKWISEKDKGQSDAINKGFKMANGEIVAWLNSDDTYEAGAIKAAVDYFIKNPQAVLVYGEGDIIDEHSKKVKRFEATQAFDLWMLINVWDYIMQPATFFKRAALESVNYLDIDLYWCMDWDLWIKLAIVGQVGYINQVFANSREYAETKTSTGGWKRFKEIVRVMRKYGDKKYPLGYYLYGASTVYTALSNQLIMKYLAKAFLYIIHRNIFRHLPVKSVDGWIGPKLELLLPGHQKTISIKGDMLFPQIIPNTIRVYKNNTFLQEIVIKDKGKFHIELLFDDASDKLNLISVITKNYLVPNNMDKNNIDRRKLCFLLEQIK